MHPSEGGEQTTYVANISCVPLKKYDTGSSTLIDPARPALPSPAVISNSRRIGGIGQFTAATTEITIFKKSQCCAMYMLHNAQDLLFHNA
jgi:hypothetical protein